MKRTLVLANIVILTLFIAVVPSHAQNALGFTAVNFRQDVPLSLENGEVDIGWDEVELYQNVTAFGEKGMAKFSHNTTHLYTLLVTASDKEWIALEFHADEIFGDSCMLRVNDGWSFYLEGNNVDAIDTHYDGSTVDPVDDPINDIFVETTVIDGYHYIEVVRHFNSTDTDGNDFSYANGTLIFVKFASDTHHKGGMFDPGPSELFFLSVGVEDVEVQAPIDFKQIKAWIAISVPIIIVLFIAIHFPVRLIFRKVHDDHPGPIIDNSYLVPRLVDRLREDFGSKEESS